MNLELFPCSGGMAEGFRRAGIAFDWAFDKDPNACASCEKNLGHRPVQMDVNDLLRMVRGGWSPGLIRLLVADPPCTPWSRAGKRLGVEDERDMLGATCELIGLLRPRAYLIGNVPGLDDSTQWHHVQEALAPLAKAGYCVADYVSLDAADYGVPQHRIRPFWFGHLDGPCVRWPAPTHGAHGGGQLAMHGLELKPWVTCREALGHLAIEDLGRPVKMRHRAQNGKEHGSVLEKPAKVVGTSNLSDGNVLLNPKHPPAHPAHPAHPAPTLGAKDRGQGTVLLMDDGHPPSTPDRPARALHADGGRAGRPESVLFVERKPDPNRPPADADAPVRTVTAAGRGAQALIEWPWDRPSTTVCRDERIPPPGHHDANSYLSTANAIVLSEKAAAILQGFPEDWLFSGETKKARWSQIGQAMPPGLAHPVAEAVKEQMQRADSARGAA